MPLVNSLINGQALAPDMEERALHYGDGVFETMLMQQGNIRLWSKHLARLQQSCERLAIQTPSEAQLQSELQLLVQDIPEQDNLLIKIIISRGTGGRGLAVPKQMPATRICLAYDYQPKQQTSARLSLCKTPLYENPQLAGIKHLNRLPYLMAAQELKTEADEGIMLNSAGEMIECITHNLFFVLNEQLVTAPIANCGVAGVMRQTVMETAQQLGIQIIEKALKPSELQQVQECFISNAVIGVQLVTKIEQYRLHQSTVFNQIKGQL